MEDFAVIPNKYDALARAMVVIESCTTLEQVKVAERYATLAAKLFGSEGLRSRGDYTFYSGITREGYDLGDAITDKRRALGARPQTFAELLEASALAQLQMDNMIREMRKLKEQESDMWAAHGQPDGSDTPAVTVDVKVKVS